MALRYTEIKDEIKRRATRDQGGTQFDSGIDNIANAALLRIAREAPWRQLRRKSTITTEGNVSTGTVAVTLDSTTWTFTGFNPLTAGIQRGRRIKATFDGGSAKVFIIDSVTATTVETTEAYDQAAGSGTYSIFGRDTYNMPIDFGRVGIVWHEDYGYPYAMIRITDREFLESGASLSSTSTPQWYRMWGENWVLEQPKAASVITVVSSAAGDTANVRVFGTVAGYPDFEQIALSGTTPVAGLKSFTDIERIVKDSSTTGRVSITADSANTTVAVLPTGNSNNAPQYSKVTFYNIPDDAFNINILYYKTPLRLVNDNDIHELGEEFDEAIILLAVSRIRGEQEMLSGSNTFFQMYKDELRTLRRHNTDELDWFPHALRPEQSRASQFGINRYLGFNNLGPNFGPMSRR